MPMEDWGELSGSVLEDTYELTTLVRGGTGRACFEGYDRNGKQAVSIQVFRPEANVDLRQIYRRFQEASFLAHPNLLRIWHVVLDEQNERVYAISERGEYDLPQFVEQRPMPPEDARDLTLQLAAGLRTIHAENLVLCNLGLDAVWKIGQEWKIADFSELRVTGHADGEVRKTLARLPAVPPEAFEGHVLPAWDTWSLGVLLQKVLTPSPTHVQGSVSLPRGRHIRLHGLPEPFDEITRDCLRPDPGARLSLSDLEQRLSTEPPPQPPSISEELGVSSPEAETAPGVRPLTRFYEDEQPKGRAWLAFLLGVLVVIALGAFWAMRQRGKPAVLPQQAAESEASRARTSPAPVATFGTPEKNKPTPAEEKVTEQPGTASIEALLNQWVKATREKNAAASASFYAPKVRTFYNHRNLTREQVRQDRARVYSQIGTVRKFEISNVQVTQLGPSSAVALFDKTWDFGPRYAGSAREQLSFGKYGGGWKITTERELKVHWVKR